MGVGFIAQTVATVCVVAALLVGIRRYLTLRQLNVVPGPSSPSFVTGNLPQMFNPNASPFHNAMVKLYGKVIRITGAFGDPYIVISDTKALYNVLIKEQNTFEVTDWFLEINRLVFGHGLLSTFGATHKKQRKILNPAFSITHMRRIIPIFHSVTKELQNIIRKELADGAKEIDMLEWMGKLALELIAQAGLGYTFNALQGENNDYAIALKSFVPTTARVAVWRRWVPVLTSYIPAPVLRVLAMTVPWPTLHAIVGIADTMYSTSKDLWEKKKALGARGEKGIVNQLGEGKDLMSILLKANSTADEKDRLPDEQLLGQMTTFLFAATDTTSSALSRILYMLALHPDVQEKLRAELTEAGSAKGQLDHDTLNDLPFLEAVCRETLRLFPPVNFAQRTARKDSVLPLLSPMKGTDGKEYSEIVVPNGTTVIVNIIGVNRDPDIWGLDATEWKPERWLKPLPESVSEAHIPGVYSNQLTFIGGGRACIGFKFSELEMKVVLSQLLPVIRFSPPAKKEIIWRFGGITTPSVVDATSQKPSLPLALCLV